MKRITVLSISLSILLLASFVTTPVVGNDVARSSNSSFDIGIDQDEEIADSYYPIFNSTIIEAGTTTQETIRNRNNTLGEGAIVQVDSEALNITFRYAVALQNTSVLDTSVTLELFADLPVVNTANFNNTGTPELSLTDGTKTLDMSYVNQNYTVLDYTHPSTGDVIPNATLYFFETNLKINMTVDYLPFYAAETTASPDISEAQDDGAYNLLTTDEYFTTSTTDEFFIQNEIVNITGNLFFNDASNIDAFGIDYRVNTGSEVSENFDLTFFANNANDTISLTDYEPGTTISWDSVLYVANDTKVNQSRVISGIDSKSTVIGDGTPQIVVEVFTNDENGLVKNNNVYSANNEITFNVTATVPKGNITDVSLLVTDSALGFTFTQINDTFNDVELSGNVTYPQETNYTTVISATTDKGLSVNETYTVYFDATDPTINSLSVSDVSGNTVVTEDGTVTFNFAFGDGNSGVMLAILDLGNGVSLGVEGMNSIDYRYEDFDGKTYLFTLTVIDFAGNEDRTSGSITLEKADLGDTSPPSYGFWIFLITVLALLTSFKWAPPVSEKLKDIIDRIRH